MSSRGRGGCGRGPGRGRYGNSHTELKIRLVTRRRLTTGSITVSVLLQGCGTNYIENRKKAKSHDCRARSDLSYPKHRDSLPPAKSSELSTVHMSNVASAIPTNITVSSCPNSDPPVQDEGSGVTTIETISSVADGSPYSAGHDHTSTTSFEQIPPAPNIAEWEHIMDEGRDSAVNLNAIDIKIGSIQGGFLDIDMDLNHDVTHEPSIDTGAFVTCTDQFKLLYRYRQFTTSAPSPIRLMPATVDSDTVPKGFGYLRVPAPNSDGYLDVRAFYTPKLRTTVIDERDFIQAAGLNPSDVTSETIKKHYESRTFTYQAVHKTDHWLDVIIHGVLQNGKSYTDVLLPPSDPQDVLEVNFLEPTLEQAYERAIILHICAVQEDDQLLLRDDFHQVSDTVVSTPTQEYIQHGLSVHALRQETERLLWHQERLGHPSDDHYLYNSHKFIDGVPKFKHKDNILEKCPTCIRAKLKKQPAGPNSTRVATQPYQGLSVDFSFAGMKLKNAERAKDFVGVKGETCWILITDHFSRMKHGATRVSKASPIEWIQDFLRTHSPKCANKYVILDQGGELYRNPEVVRIFKKAQYEVYPTGADASNQNGPVERGHLTVADHIRAMLFGANLDIQFWPFAFHHWLRIDNSIPSRDQTQAPLMISQGKRDDFSGFRTFGCRVWVRPSGTRPAKFAPHARKGIFLGFQPNTTQNILWYDPEYSIIKIAKHDVFDEGMNDLAHSAHLLRLQQGDDVPAKTEVATIPEFDIGSSPYFHTILRPVKVTCRNREYGFEFATDTDNNRAFVANIKANSSAAKIFSSLRATNNKIRGAYIVSINGEPVFTIDEVLTALHDIRSSKASQFTMEFAPERRLSALERHRVAHKHEQLFSPTDDVYNDYVHHSITVGDIQAIAPAIRFEDHDSFQPPQLPLSDIHLSINAIRSATTLLTHR
eukprot:scaffold946_cov73-Cylindrotheca_fusiformis.AAC.2